MEPIALFITDTHLTRDNIPLVESIFDQAIEVCKEQNIKLMIHGGDVFTSRSGQPLDCLVSFSNILRKIKECGIRFVAIAGNHDKTDGDDSRSYLSVYDGLEEYRDGGIFQYGGLEFVMMPYFREEKWLSVFGELDKKRNKKKKSFLITHIGFDGVMNNDGSKVESRIKPSMFKEYEAVLIGHYHNASRLGDNVHYTGSAYQNNFGESIQDKGFSIIYEDGTIERVRSEFPMYIKVKLDAGDKEAISKAIQTHANDSENFVRFVFQGTKDKCDNISVEELATKYGIDCKFEVDTTIRAMELSEENVVLSYDASTIMSDFEEFCKDSGINSKKKLNFGRELIKGISNVEA